MQTLSPSEWRQLAAWAAACVERVLWICNADTPADCRARAALARTWAFARGQSNTAYDIRTRFGSGGSAREMGSSAATAVARVAGQASAISHMGAHALGAAAYAVKAVSLAAPEKTDAAENEIRWQLAHTSPGVRAALKSLPRIGENRSGPLGPGLLASGHLGTIVLDIQTRLATTEQY